MSQYLDLKYTNPINISNVDKLHNLRPFNDAPTTKESLNFLELPAIDLSKFQYGPEHLSQRKALAKELETGLTVHGFFNIIGHGIPIETFQKMQSLAQSIFEIDLETKQKFLAGKQLLEEEKDRQLGIIRGTGYKPKGYWEYVPGQKDLVELFNYRHFLHDEIFFKRTNYPEFIKYHLLEIQSYFKFIHYEILRKVLNLMDLILEIPEGFLYDQFFNVEEGNLTNSGGGYGRFLWYHPPNAEYIKNTKNTMMRGHSDASGLTFIAPQSVTALQIQDYLTNTWKFVKPQPNAMVVNVGDALQHLTGGYFKSTIHRVVAPPNDQISYNRCCIIYFCGPKPTTIIDPSSLNSKKLNEKGYKLPDGVEHITFKQWDEAKGTFFNAKNKTQKGAISILGRKTLGSLLGDEESPKVVAVDS